VTDGRAAPPRWVLLGTLLFTLLVPGTVVGVVPWWITRWRLADALLARAGGALILVVGSPLFLSFLARFVREGHGTPAPVAPPQHLVVGGPFRWTRNPGYVGVLMLLVGQALLFASLRVLLYAGCVALAFHAFVVLYEEPVLARQFGAEYDEYRRRVPRWLPRAPRPR